MDNVAQLLELLRIEAPIIQAPMAGVSTPEMAAAVSNAGALGSLAVGPTDAAGARQAIAAFRQRSRGPFNVNVFCNQPARADQARELRWLERLRPEFERLGATPPASLSELYRSFVEDDAKLAVLLDEKPAVVSFHFGLPPQGRVRALRDAGIVLIGSATNLADARALVSAGLHAVVAQGYEAGGHRGVFDPEREDEELGTFALTRLFARELPVPIIAAGGIMDGAGVAAALRLGASAAQLGTAFIACEESLASADYRAALNGEPGRHTVMTRSISGRPARALPNRLTALGHGVAASEIPAYPIAYDAAKALQIAAKARGESGYAPQWAGQGAPLSRALPAAELVATLRRELAQIG